MKTLRHATSAALMLGAFVSITSCSTTSMNATTDGTSSESPEFTPMRPIGRPMTLMAGVPFRLQGMPIKYVTPDAPAYVAPEEELASFTHPLQDSILVRTTAYCHDENDHLAYGKLSAAGTVLKYGDIRSAAADWSRYPLGTRFRIANEPGVVYQVDDYGSALVGSGTIDLYRPTMGDMDAWGVRNVDIEIIQWGSYEDSLRLMRDRTKYPHVRRMVDDIENKDRQTTTQNDISTTPATAIAAPINASGPGSSLSM